MIIAALLGASVVVAQPVDSATALQAVNPELRPIAAAILKAPPPRVSAGKSVPPPPVPAGVEQRTITGAAGAPPVTIFVVNKTVTPASRGAVLFIHGGGFVAGDARDNLRSLVKLSQKLDCLIVSVQYRLAPATPFPGALDDNYAALKWLHDSASTLGVDPSRIVVMGESAGGGHAAMLVMAARKRGEVPLAGQVLVYPMLDDRTGSTFTVAPSQGQLIWHVADNIAGWSALLGTSAGAAHVPAGSVPARITDLRGLPPTFIGVGSIDLFADEDIDFARRLIDAGVPTELLVEPGGFHGFQLIMPQAAISRHFSDAIESALGRMLARGPVR